MKENKTTVLYVDDEEINLLLFEEMFKKDFNIVTFSTPSNVIEYLREYRVDVVISDQSMPEMLGTQLLESIHDLFQEDAPLLGILSGYNRNEVIDAGFKKNIISFFIQKPWKGDELRSVINKRFN